MITVIGSAVLDIVLKIKSQNFKEGDKVEVAEFDFSLGGGALNASVTFKKLGLKPEVYFHLGKDFLGKILLEKIEKLNLKTKIFFHPQATTFSLILLPPNKDRIIFVYRGKESDFKISELNKIKPKRYLYLTPGLTKPPVLLKFFKKIRKQIKYLAINPSKIFLQSKMASETLKFADFIFVNEEELRLFKKDFQTEIFTLAKKIYRELKPKSLIVTLGDKGSLAVFDDKIYRAGIFLPKKIVDKTGAGDAFASAFFGKVILNSKLDENTLKEALSWGSANSSAVIQKLGAQNGILNKKDYLRFKNLKIKIV